MFDHGRDGTSDGTVVMETTTVEAAARTAGVANGRVTVAGRAVPDGPRATGTTADAAALARRFKALSDEKRLRILALLRAGERCVCELTEALDAGQSLLSFHLKTLKDAGLVTDRRDGRWIYYSANADALSELEGVIADLAPRAVEAVCGDDCCDR